jgi:hypothetical protein
MLLNVLLVTWMYCHSLAHDNGFGKQAFFQSVYEASPTSKTVSRYIVRATTLGMYDVSNRGIVSKSDIAYAYVKWYHRDVQGRVLKYAAVCALFTVRHVTAVPLLVLGFVAVPYIRAIILRARSSWSSSTPTRPGS